MDIERLALILGGIVALVGLVKGLNEWRAARDDAIRARARQDDALAEIAAEFRPRNGRTLAHTVADIDRGLQLHCAKADEWFAENHDAHQEIHRRIDGLFEVLGTSTTPRKVAERHRNREDQ